MTRILSPAVCALAAILVLALVAMAPAQAPDPGPVPDEDTASLIHAMAIPELLEVIRDEGVVHSEALAAAMFPGRGGAPWSDRVARIHDPARMEAIFGAALASGLAPAEVEAARDFFASDPGARIVRLEISARIALLDPSVQEAAEEAYLTAGPEAVGRLQRIRRLATILELIDLNVAGSLNANLAFFDGFNAAGGFGDPRPEQEILRDVWAQEPDLRDEAELWVMSYLMMAYEPLSDDDLAAYARFSESPAGQSVNRAVFEAFDQVFRLTSRELGIAAAETLAGEDI